MRFICLRKKVHVKTLSKHFEVLLFDLFFSTRFTHKGNLNSNWLRCVENCILFWLMAEKYVVVPQLLSLITQLLGLKVKPSNVWQVLAQTVNKPHLAAVCNKVIIFI